MYQSMESYHLNLNDENASESDIPWQQETTNGLVTAAHNRVESGSGELVDIGRMHYLKFKAT